MHFDIIMKMFSYSLFFSSIAFNIQASSQSSFKLSPLPKLNQEADESRRNSPANQQSVLNIKQELLDMGTHANLPQELIPVSIFIIIFYTHTHTPLARTLRNTIHTDRHSNFPHFLTISE